MPKPPKSLPPLPAVVPSVLGPVPVTRTVELRERETGRECLGIWRPGTRTVEVDAGVSSIAAWHTYWHEWAHIALYDVGVKLDKEVEEHVCDALATARVREMLDSNGR